MVAGEFGEGRGVQAAEAEGAQGVAGEAHQGEAALHADLAVDGLDVRVEGVVRDAHLIGELFFAAVGIEAAEDLPLALGEAIEGLAEGSGARHPDDEAFEGFAKLAGEELENFGQAGGEAGIGGLGVDDEEHAVAVIDGPGEDGEVGEAVGVAEVHFGAFAGGEDGAAAVGQGEGLEVDLEQILFQGGRGVGVGVAAEENPGFAVPGLDHGEAEGLDAEHARQIVGDMAEDLGPLEAMGHAGGDVHQEFGTGPRPIFFSMQHSTIPL